MALHYFNQDVAVECGMAAAVLLQNIYYWCEKNAENNKHFYDGLTWTYNSNKAWSNMFPYLTEKQIRASLDKLKKEGYIATGNYNKAKWDRTLWYAITEKGKARIEGRDFKEVKSDNQKGQMELPSEENGFALQGESICPTGQMELPSEENGFALQGKPIPNINTYINTDSKQAVAADIRTAATAPNPFCLWEQNIGLLTPILAEKLQAIIEDCSEVTVCEAIQEAIIYNRRSLAYVKAVAESKKNGTSYKPRAKPTYNKGYKSQADISAELDKALEGVDLPNGW